MKQTGRSAAGEKMPSILDRELTEFSEDAFGHNHFAQALRNLIEGPFQPPYSIGLLGSWGTGKSTIKQLYLSSLKNDSTGSKGKRRKDRIRPITFNAWRYGGEEDIKRALLRHAFIQLGGDELELHRELYQQVNQATQAKRGFWEWVKEATLQNAASALIFLVLLAAIVGIIWLFVRSIGLSDQFGLSVLVPTAGLVSVFLARYVVDIRLKSPTLFSPQTTISFPSTSAEEYERLLLEQIGRFRESSEGRSCECLVIFVDDLDRLSAPEMVSGLDAVRTFLELPISSAGGKFGVVFVISCDEDRVADALSPRGRVRVNPDLPASVLTRADARRYLDRLFQFRLEIPLFPKLDMRQFAEKKLKEAGSIASEIEQQGVRLQDVVERLIHVGVQSPRNAIQILNAFMQTWWIAVQRERSGTGSSAPGALYDGAVTNHPLALAALCVLRVDFPDFFNELQKRPDLIYEFTAVVFRNQSIDSIAFGGQEALKNFLAVGQNGELRNEARSEHRGLRQYLSSLIGLRWPKSLQPLLLLSQDAVSRKFGDRAAELHDAFVSGDIQGVLEVFGHHLDSDELGRDDVRLLEDLAEGLSDETEMRRINAARVLAALAHRIPTEYRGGLMIPLARQMAAIKDIRMNVGPALIGEVIEPLPSSDRQDVADSFARDLLIAGKLEWRLPSGETPNLEELIQDVKAAVAVVLNVRAGDGLLAGTDALLRSWLLSREVQSEVGSQTLGFSELEAWLSDHECHLLELLGEDYADQAIAEFERDSVSIPDVAATLRRVADIHRQLSESGQESRRTLWQQLDRLVAARNASASAAAWHTAGIHAVSASEPQARAFLAAMANRLQKDMGGDDGWDLDWESGAQQLLDLATRWEDHIDPKTGMALAPLLTSWGDGDECAGFMVRGADILLRRDREAWDTIVDYIVGTSLTELPWRSLEYAALKLDSLTEEQRSALAGQMNALIDTDSIDADGAANYQKLIPAISGSGWSSGPLQAHAKKLRGRLLALFNQPDYLSTYFPAARDLLGFAPKGEAAAFLKQLFEQAAGAPAAYPILHREMADAWPEENEQIGKYESTGIVQRSIQFMNENPAAEGIGYVLESVVDLVDCNLADDGVRPNVSSATAALWRHAPEAVAACAEKIASYLSPADVKTITVGKQPSEFNLELLKAVLRFVVDASDQMKCVSIAKEILGVAPAQIDDEPDGAFVVWCSTLDAKASGVLKALISDDALNDDQRERVLRYAAGRSESLGLEFFIDILPMTLSRPEESKSLTAAVAKIDDIAELASTTDQKNTLVSALIPTMSNLPRDALSAIAKVVQRAGGKGAMERADILDELDGDQLQVISDEFPDSRLISQRIGSGRDTVAD